MKEELKCKLPTWYKGIGKDKYYMVLSNDFDSYYSCKILNQLFGLQIGGYFDLNNGLYINPERAAGKEPICVDLSITKGKCFDNHMTFITNPECINPNIIATDYYHKYNGGTLPFLISLYERDLSKYSQKQLNAMITIDAWDAGYYKNDGQYRDAAIDWMQKLEADKYLLPIFQAHKDRKYFNDFRNYFHLNDHIVMSDNHLYCSGRNLAKIKAVEFELAYKVKRSNASGYAAEKIYEQNPNSIITAAETFKNQYSICRKAG